MSSNNDQSNLAQSGIAVAIYPTSCLYSPVGSTGLTVCLQFATARFGWGLDPKISPSQGVSDPHLTQCVTGPRKCTCQMASKSVERFKQGAWMWQTTDRQTTLWINV